ncbi:MAG: hypothetical protein ACO3A2_02775 [Bdellovibrionia bacterium]
MKKILDSKANSSVVSKYRFELLALLIGSIACPSMAWAEKRSLSLKEIQSVISDFQVHIEPISSPIDDEYTDSERPEAEAEVVFYGVLFKDCYEGALQIQPHENPNSSSCKNSLGFEFLADYEALKKCVTEHRKQKHKCAKEPSQTSSSTLNQPCVLLSQNPQFRVPLQDPLTRDLGIKLVYENLNKDKDRLQCLDFSSTPLVFSSSHLKKEKLHQEQKAQQLDQEQKVKFERAQKITHLQSQICTHCASQKQWQEAVSANEELLAMKAIEKALFDQNEEHLKLAQFDLLLSNITQGSLEELDSVEEKLHTWATENPADVEKVADGIRSLAARYTNKPNAKPEDWEQAAQTVKKGLTLKKLPYKKKKAFEQALGEIRVGRIQSMAQYGSLRNPYPFQIEYSRVLRETEHQAWSVCLGFQANQEQCAETLKLRQAMQNIPAIAMAADQQLVQGAQQLNQALNPSLPMSPISLPGAPMTLPVGGTPAQMTPPPNNPPVAPLVIPPTLTNTIPQGMTPGVASPIYPFGGQMAMMNPMGGAFPNAGMNPFNPMTGGMYPGVGLPPSPMGSIGSFPLGMNGLTGMNGMNGLMNYPMPGIPYTNPYNSTPFGLNPMMQPSYGSSFMRIGF